MQTTGFDWETKHDTMSLQHEIILAINPHLTEITLGNKKMYFYFQ